MASDPALAKQLSDLYGIPGAPGAEATVVKTERGRVLVRVWLIALCPGEAFVLMSVSQPRPLRGLSKRRAPDSPDDDNTSSNPPAPPEQKMYVSLPARGSRSRKVRSSCLILTISANDCV